MERSLEFYTKVLGLDYVHHSSTFVTFKTGQVNLQIRLTEKPSTPDLARSVDLPQVTFKVNDLEEALAHLRQAKVTITGEILEISPMTFIFNFLDPDGNSLACLTHLGH